MHSRAYALLATRGPIGSSTKEGQWGKDLQAASQDIELPVPKLVVPWPMRSQICQLVLHENGRAPSLIHL